MRRAGSQLEGRECRAHAPFSLASASRPASSRWLLTDGLRTPWTSRTSRGGEQHDLCRWLATWVPPARRPGDWVLAADTVVEIDGRVLGKPVDDEDAKAMLACLAGREHRVFTGFALLAPGGDVRAAEVVVSRVRFRPLDARAIATYVASEEPADKAGAYGIQGLGSGLIAAIEGSFTNVVGLPLFEVERALREAGLLPPRTGPSVLRVA